MVVAAAEPQTARVLCVDDNWDAADSEAAALAALGFDTRACYDGPAALRLAAEFDPDTCLIDLNMPGKDGDELAARLRTLPGGGPPLLIAVTGMGDAASRVRIAAAGFDGCFVKPPALDALAAAIAGRRRPPS